MTGVAGPQGAIIRFALRFRGIIVALSGLLVAYGIYTLGHASYDVFPEFAPPQANIQTEAPGLSPEQVEMLVTRPIETAINGVPNLDRMISSSVQGLSVVTVYFDPSSDIYRGRQLVSERLTTAVGLLPSSVQSPIVTPLTSSTGTVLMAGLTSSSQSLMRLRAIAKWTIRPSLLSVPGVAGVEIFGGEDSSIQILVRRAQLIRFGLGMNDVIDAAREASGVRGAGFISTPNQRVILQTEGQSVSPGDIARTVLVRHAGASVTLGDVASVIEAPEPAIGGASVMGQPGVVMNITAQYGANTLEVAKGVESALADIRPALEQDGVILHDALFRPANFISTAVGSLSSALLVGGVLVAIILFLFLFDLRTAAICCSAIPLSLLAAVALLQHFGVTLNTMTLGGLAIALGEVVDDAVIGVENTARRLRENKRRLDPQPAARVVLEATFEVRSAVVYATFAVILVFLPVIALSGIAGRLFGPLGVTYILAVLASLAVAVTVTPALSLLLLPQHTPEAEPPVVHWARHRYEIALRRIARAPRLAIAAAAVLTLASLALLPFFGATFLPDLKEEHFVVHMTAMPGTSITESLRMGARVTEALARLPIVRSVAQRAGRAELTADTNGTHHSEFDVDLKPLSSDAAESAKVDILKALTDFPGVNFYVNTFLTERINETLSGYTAPVAINVFGNDLKAIAATAERIAQVLSDMPGATSVQVQSPPGLPQLAIKLRQADLEHWGLEPVQVLDAVRAAYQGDIVGQSYQGDRVFDVVVKLAPENDGGIAGIGNLTLRASDGVYVPLQQIADVRVTSGLYQIQHHGGRRLQTVTLDVQGQDLVSFVHAAQQRLAEKLKLPSGTYISFSGAAEGQARAQRDLALKAMFAGAGVVILLSVITRSWRNLVLVLVNLPFAAVGGVVAAFAFGGVLSLGSLIGFVTLLGITLRNSMMMISHYEHLVEMAKMPWGLETAVHGAANRSADPQPKPEHSRPRSRHRGRRFQAGRPQEPDQHQGHRQDHERDPVERHRRRERLSRRAPAGQLLRHCAARRQFQCHRAQRPHSQTGQQAGAHGPGAVSPDRGPLQPLLEKLLRAREGPAGRRSSHHRAGT
jgi:CzcA family heavy metal efflux pump